ncbi:MAG: T9SS type A sorting domain-containing protein [Acidobacteriota bacterium]
MSFNKFKFTGKVVKVVAPHTRDWYVSQGWKRQQIQQEIIQQLDATQDFAEFDKWTLNGGYSQTNNPDNKVDWACFIWRNVADDYNHYMNDFTMGWIGDLGFYSVPVDGGARILENNGATIPSYFAKDPFRFTIHELAHYLLGGNEMHNGHAFWAMLSGYEVRSYMANAFERYKLGWINLTTVGKTSQTISGATLPDFITTGVAYRVEIDAATNQYFYIENHQRISPWDNCSSVSTEKGIYVMRQDRAQSTNGMAADWMWLVPASGRYNWVVNEMATRSYFGGYLPVYTKLAANKATGYSETDMIPFNYNGYTTPNELLILKDPATGAAVDYLARIGHGKDAFREGFNEVFTPWSNPNSQRADRNATGIGFKINGAPANGVYSLDIYVNQAYAAPPSKPQNVVLNANPGDNCNRLSWDYNDNAENVAYYEVSRKLSAPYDPWEVIGTTTNNFFVDPQFYYLTSGNEKCTYRVRVKSNANQYSVYSDEVSGRAEPLYKRGDNNEQEKLAEKVDSWALRQNYPNPFNPRTQIYYSLKENSQVNLQVYDMLGNKVADLVNDIKPAGEYSVSFDGSNLPSGIYIYQLRTGSYTSMRKMLLLK